jgi:hypothetical protein
MAHLFPSAGRQAYLESYHVDVEPNSAVDLTRPDVRTIDSPFYRNVYVRMPVSLCLSFFFWFELDQKNVRIFWMSMDGSPDSLQTVTTQVRVVKLHLGHIFKMATRCISPLWF